MRKLFQIGTVFFCILMTSAFAQDINAQSNAPVTEGYATAGADQGVDYSSQEQAPCDTQCKDESCNDCWCKFCHYEPCYYYTKRCVQEQIPCKKTCCRWCPKYYQVQRCRYVPQYYCETCCRNEPEYYEVDDCKTCTRYVCDKHCRWVPKYYWKHVCGDANCTTPCPR